MVRKCKFFNFTFTFALFAVLYTLLIKTALSPQIPTPENPLILYSNQTRDDLRIVLKRSFSSALHSISIWMYAITDPLLLKTLTKKSTSNVHIHTTFDANGGTPKLPASLHPTPCHGRGLMHRKIVIIDSATVFLGSANMTTSSLQTHDNLTLGVYHPGLAHFLESPHQNAFPFQIGNTSALLWLLPDPTALTAIQQHLAAATHSIFVAMFTLTHPVLIDTLIEAHNRGVAVTVALDRYTAKGASKRAVKKLTTAGIPLYLSSNLPLLHHKWVYIDEERLILGSTNWTDAAFCKNQDLLLFLHPLSQSMCKKMKAIMSALRTEGSTEYVLASPS